MAFETETHYQRHSDGKDAARQGQQRSGEGKKVLQGVGFVGARKNDPPLRIALKETDDGLAGPPSSPFCSRLASCP
ncbi:hypothetical protein QLX08_004869 [Tetragonisca angustula]|uniref:Uncharacterized protein n=1 Tax=Tetragonisca angustula TaxID=166442 RepID=A0AAW1A0V5_9HYME